MYSVTSSYILENINNICGCSRLRRPIVWNGLQFSHNSFGKSKRGSQQ